MLIAHDVDNGPGDSDEDDDIGIITSICNGKSTEWGTVQGVPLNCAARSHITNWLVQQQNAGILVLECLLMQEKDSKTKTWSVTALDEIFQNVEASLTAWWTFFRVTSCQSLKKKSE